MRMTRFESLVWSFLDWVGKDDTSKFFVELAGVLLLATILGLLCYIEL